MANSITAAVTAILETSVQITHTHTNTQRFLTQGCVLITTHTRTHTTDCPTKGVLIEQ